MMSRNSYLRSSLFRARCTEGWSGTTSMQFDVFGLTDPVNATIPLGVDHGRRTGVGLHQPLPTLQVCTHGTGVRHDYDVVRAGLELTLLAILVLR